MHQHKVWQDQSYFERRIVQGLISLGCCPTQWRKPRVLSDTVEKTSKSVEHPDFQKANPVTHILYFSSVSNIGIFLQPQKSGQIYWLKEMGCLETLVKGAIIGRQQEELGRPAAASENRPPKTLKNGKPRFGESTLTWIVQDTPNLTKINLYFNLGKRSKKKFKKKTNKC